MLKNVLTVLIKTNSLDWHVPLSLNITSLTIYLNTHF